MIPYSPVDGDVVNISRIAYRPRTCFIMTQLGTPLPREIVNMRRTFAKYCSARGIDAIDANSVITGKDFLVKIWEMLVSVPLGVAVIAGDLTPSTMCNIFYEIGLLDALGKETLVIETTNSYVPSDFVRTEYIEYDKCFKSKINKFFDRFFGQADYYADMAAVLSPNPLLAIDYLKRAYLISGEDRLREEARRLFDGASFDKQTAEGVEHFLRS